LTVVQLARVPFAIGTIAAARGSSSGQRHFDDSRQRPLDTGSNAAIGGKPVPVGFVDMNTLKVTTPALNAGRHRVAVANPYGETTPLVASLAAS